MLDVGTAVFFLSVSEELSPVLVSFSVSSSDFPSELTVVFSFDFLPSAVLVSVASVCPQAANTIARRTASRSVMIFRLKIVSFFIRSTSFSRIRDPSEIFK